MSDTITVIGNIATDPEIRRTSSGVPVMSFRLACGQRRYDRATDAWVDSGTNWYTVSAFRALAVNAMPSLSKGDPVIVTGRLRVRDWDNGVKRGTAVEIDADALGHDLRWGSSRFRRSDGKGGARVAEAGDAWEAGGADASDATSVPEEGSPDSWAVPADADDGAERALVAAGAATEEVPF